MNQGDPGDDDPDDGLAVERTSLAWTRTALSFAGSGALAARLLWEDHFALGSVTALFAFVIAAATYVHGRRSYLDRREGRRRRAPPILVGAVAIGTALIALTAGLAEVL